MKPIHVDLIGAIDVDTLVQYVTHSPENLLDRDVFFYPHTKVLKAATATSTLMFLPAQVTLTIDSPGIAPDATKLDVARSLKKLLGKFEKEARDAGIREINFFTSSDAMAEFAKNHGYEEIPHRLFRRKLVNPLPGMIGAPNDPAK
jgi:hypothetical protein